MAETWIGRCLRSLQDQVFQNWRAMVTVDAAGDATYPNALRAAAGDPRIQVIRNDQPLYWTANLARAIARSNADPEDVIAVLDGDDWLTSSRSLATLTAAYDDPDCWMTYGSWISSAYLRANPDLAPGDLRRTADWKRSDGLWRAYHPEITDFRTSEWLATQVRSWKRWFWSQLDQADLKDENGQYFRVAGDVAVMFPLLEMSGPSRARHIADPLMVYNMENPLSCYRFRVEERDRNTAFIRAKPPYPRLNAKPQMHSAAGLP